MGTLDKADYPEKVWRVHDLVRGRRPAEDETEAHFVQYFHDNPQIWDGFRKFAHEARDSGKDAASAWLIINRLRWEYFIETSDENSPEFKIANEYIAMYARLYMELGHCPHFFRTKPRKVELRRIREIERGMNV